MNVYISNASEKPIYEQIYTQIKSAILRGECKAGEALPSIRALAKELRISVITTKRAFDDLERDGYVYSVQGKGSFVAEKNKELVREEYLNNIEIKFAEIKELAQLADISREELFKIFSLIVEEDEYGK